MNYIPLGTNILVTKAPQALRSQGGVYMPTKTHSAVLRVRILAVSPELEDANYANGDIIYIRSNMGFPLGPDENQFIVDKIYVLAKEQA